MYFVCEGIGRGSKRLLHSPFWPGKAQTSTRPWLLSEKCTELGRERSLECWREGGGGGALRPDYSEREESYFFQLLRKKKQEAASTSIANDDFLLFFSRRKRTALTTLARKPNPPLFSSSHRSCSRDFLSPSIALVLQRHPLLVFALVAGAQLSAPPARASLRVCSEASYALASQQRRC